MARYRGQRSAWQVGAAIPTPPLFAALGLSCRRLAIAGNEMLSILRAHLRFRRFKFLASMHELDGSWDCRDTDIQSCL
jgi:hypothetical protein